MDMIWFVVIALALVLLGGVWVRRERRKRAAERERKLKIAEGIVEKTKAPFKKKRRSRRWFKKDAKPILPAEMANSQRLKELTVKLLELYNAGKTALVPLKAAGVELQQASQLITSMWVHNKLSKSGFRDNLSRLPRAQLRSRLAHRQFAKCALAYRIVYNNFQKAKEVLTNEVKHLATFDTQDCSPEYQRLLLAATLLSEQAYLSLSESQLEHHDYGPPDQKSPPDARSKIDSALEVLAVLAESTYELCSLYHDCAALKKELDEARKQPTLKAPAKPVDADVQDFLREVETWSAAVQAAEGRMLKELKLLSAQLEAQAQARAQAQSVKPNYSQGELDDSDAGAVTAFHSVFTQLDTIRTAIAKDFDNWQGEDLFNALTALAVTSNWQEKLASINNATRKLAFALAQRSSVNDKLAQTNDTPAATVKVNEATLAEASAESFMRAYNRMKLEQGRNKEKVDARNTRITDLKAQQTERGKQVLAAAKALDTLVNQLAPKGVAVPAEVDKAIKAARMLHQQYKS